MAKDNTILYLAVGAIGLGMLYLITRQQQPVGVTVQTPPSQTVVAEGQTIVETVTPAQNENGDFMYIPQISPIMPFIPTPCSQIQNPSAENCANGFCAEGPCVYSVSPSQCVCLSDVPL